MTAEELFAARTTERDALATALLTMTDPQEITDTVSRITELTSQMFGSLSETEKKANAESYATYLEGVNTTAQGLITSALEGIDDQMIGMNYSADQMLAAATSMQGVATDFGIHMEGLRGVVRDFDAVVAALQANGIRIRVETPDGIETSAEVVL
jgi:hypothetical protein